MATTKFKKVTGEVPGPVLYDVLLDGERIGRVKRHESISMTFYLDSRGLTSTPVIEWEAFDVDGTRIKKTCRTRKGAGLYVLGAHMKKGVQA